MLMRYAHLCASRLAKKLDESFKDESKVRLHKGRRLLAKNATVTVAEAVDAQPTCEPLGSNVIAFPQRRAA